MNPTLANTSFLYRFKNSLKMKPTDIINHSIRNYIFGLPNRSMMNGHIVEVIKSVIIDGEQVIITFIPEDDQGQWCIYVKQKYVLASTQDNLVSYKRDKSYNEVVEVANHWFKTLETMRSRKIRTKDFINSVKSKLLIWSYVGNPWHSKIMKYSQNDLIFQYIVNQNETKGYIWEPPEVWCKFFKKWGLISAPFSRIGFYSTLSSLFTSLSFEYNQVKTGRIKIRLKLYREYFVKRKRSIHYLYR